MAVLRAVPVHSSLGLQKLLYFNAWHSLVFGGVQVALCAYKLGWLGVSRDARIYLPVLVSVWAAVEALRLWLGYAGNLGEKARCLRLVCRRSSRREHLDAPLTRPRCHPPFAPAGA